jgi:hypothetical protein
MLRYVFLFSLLLPVTSASAQLLASIREASFVASIGYLPESKLDTFLYDLNGRLTAVHQLNLGSFQNIAERKQLLQYNHQGRLDCIYWLRADAFGKFDSTGYDQYHYNAVGKVKNISHYWFTDGRMQLSQEQLFTYSNDGRLRSKEKASHHTPNWRIIEKEDYHYNGQGRLDSISFFIWRDGRLQPASRYVYNYYDSIGEEYIVIESLNPWTLQSEKTGEYRNFYNSQSGLLDSSTRVFIHDQNSHRYKIEYRRLPNDSLLETEEFAGSPWQPRVKRTYNYRDFQPLQKLVVSTQLNIFPNPAQQQVQIDQLGAAGGQLLIFDLRGQLQKSEILYSDRQVLFVGDLTAGIYILQLTTPEGQTSTARLVKQ